MQHNLYHVYTVDEHTIRAIGILSQIENGQLADELPMSTEVMPKLLSRRELYVAVFLHDIAKGRGGDHSELGEAGRQAAVPALGPAGRRHRDRGLAGPPPPRHEPLRLQARQRGPADDPGLRRHRAVARAAEAAAAADRDRHPRRRPERLERLEGPAAARALPGGRGGDGDRRPAGPARATDRDAPRPSLAEALRGPAGRAVGGRGRSRPIWPATIRATGWACRPRSICAMR